MKNVFKLFMAITVIFSINSIMAETMIAECYTPGSTGGFGEPVYTEVDVYENSLEINIENSTYFIDLSNYTIISGGNTTLIRSEYPQDTRYISGGTTRTTRSTLTFSMTKRGNEPVFGGSIRFFTETGTTSASMLLCSKVN